MDIVLRNVCKSFGKQPIIRDLTLSIQSGDIFGLLGPSGSGKTTTIRLLIGAIAADSGNIAFDDIEVPNLKLLSRIGFMPQNDALSHRYSFQGLSHWIRFPIISDTYVISCQYTTDVQQSKK